MLNIKLNNSSLKAKICVAALLFFSQPAFACHWYDVPCHVREAEERAKDVARGVERGVIFVADILNVVRGEVRTAVRDVHTAAPFVPGSEDWMSSLSDEIPLSKLTIPGTHDSGSGALHLLGVPTVVPWAKLCFTILGDTFCVDEEKIRAAIGTDTTPGAMVETQYWTIAEQLKHGIRFLDIRIVGDGPYTLHHGPVPLGDFYLNAMKPVGEFLHQHPGEVVFMSVKEEIEGKLNKNKFVSEFIRNALALSSGAFVTDGGTKSLAETKLRDVRGKVVLFNRMDNETTKVDGNAVGGVVWGDQQKQDVYTNYWGCHFENTSSIPWTKGGCDTGRADKTKVLRAFIDKLDTSGTKFNINFASAQMNIKDQSTALDIVGNAWTQNGALLSHFKEYGFNKNAGQIIVMDYPAYVAGQIEPNELLKLIITRANQGK